MFFHLSVSLSVDWIKAKTPDKVNLEELLKMAVNGNMDEFFKDKKIMAFFVELRQTYLLSGVRDAEGVKNRMNNKGCMLVFQLLGHTRLLSIFLRHFSLPASCF